MMSKWQFMEMMGWSAHSSGVGSALTGKRTRRNKKAKRVQRAKATAKRRQQRKHRKRVRQAKRR